MRTYAAYHYSELNEDRPLNIKKHGFIDLQYKTNPLWYLSRYEALGAILIPSYYDKDKAVTIPRRVMFSLTPIVQENENAIDKPLFYLIQILSTLCVDSFTHFLMYDAHIQQAVMWTTWNQSYRCDIHSEISEPTKQLLLEKREHYLRIRGMIYDPDKGYIRDMHKPENAAREKVIKNWTVDQVKKAEEKWKLMLGPPLSSKISLKDISKVNDSITIGDDLSNERRRSSRNPVIKAPMNISIPVKRKRSSSKTPTKEKTKRNQHINLIMDQLEDSPLNRNSDSENKLKHINHLNYKIDMLEKTVSTAFKSAQNVKTDVDINKDLRQDKLHVERLKLLEMIDIREKGLIERENKQLKDSRQMLTTTYDKLIESSSKQIEKVSESCSSDRSWLAMKEDNARLERENSAQRAHVERMRELELRSQERAALEREAQRTEREKAILLSNRSCKLM